jgi:hypothetical protein
MRAPCKDQAATDPSPCRAHKAVCAASDNKAAEGPEVRNGSLVEAHDLHRRQQL